MKKIILLILLLMLPLGAQAVTAVPEGVTHVEDEAFAGAGIDALIIPASVETVGADVLQGSRASYIYLEGADTTLSGAPGVPFIFAPASSPASGMAGFYPADMLMTDSGLYYAVGMEAIPLCAKEPDAFSGSVTIPKLLAGSPVTTLDALYLDHTAVSEIRAPQYLSAPDDLPVTPYQTLFVTAPATDTTQSPAGHFITWTTSVQGAYGDVTYLWQFTVGGETLTQITTEPTIQYAPMAEGECIVTVTAEDAVGDSALSPAGAPVTITPAQPRYRALLIGNTYTNDPIANLAGPDTDVYSMQTVLNSMTGTPFDIQMALNVSASAIPSYFSIAFAGAQPSDVSLFYYSGHGLQGGALLGTGGTQLPVNTLRTALQRIPGTKIVILDCCYSGASINRSAPAEPTRSDLSAFNSAIISGLKTTTRSSVNLADQGFIVLTSCRKDQTSQSLNDGVAGISFGIFTYGLCYGSGYDEWKQTALGYMPADTNLDGAITLGESYATILERVAYIRSMLSNVTQETQYYGDSSFVLWRK